MCPIGSSSPGRTGSPDESADSMRPDTSEADGVPVLAGVGHRYVHGPSTNAAPSRQDVLDAAQVDIASHRTAECAGYDVVLERAGHLRDRDLVRPSWCRVTPSCARPARGAPGTPDSRDARWRRRPSRRFRGGTLHLLGFRRVDLEGLHAVARSPPSSERRRSCARRRRRRRPRGFLHSSPPSGSPEDTSAPLSAALGRCPRPRLPSWSGGDGGSWVRGSSAYPVLGALSSVKGARRASSLVLLERQRRLRSTYSAALASSSENRSGAPASSQVSWQAAGRYQARPGRQVPGSSDAARIAWAHDSVSDSPMVGAPPMPRPLYRREGEAIERWCAAGGSSIGSSCGSHRGACRDIHSPQLSHNTDLHQPMEDTFNLTHPTISRTITPRQSDTCHKTVT